MIITYVNILLTSFLADKVASINIQLKVTMIGCIANQNY